MEVHHHGHVRHEKKWKNYLFQFFMLFLAVFLGFLAEFLLEQKIERKQEKEYIHLLIGDLQLDLSILQKDLPSMKQAIRGLDTLIDQTYKYLEGKGDTRLMYYTYHHYCRNRFVLDLSQRTMNQLKNSGNMRLIHDQAAGNILTNIETGFESLRQRTEFFYERQNDPSSYGMKIFDFREYQKANVDSNGITNTNDDGFLKLSYRPLLNISDPIYLKEFAARVGYYRNTFSSYVDKLEGSMPFITNAIATLEKNYGIANKEMAQQ